MWVYELPGVLVLQLPGRRVPGLALAIRFPTFLGQHPVVREGLPRRISSIFRSAASLASVTRSASPL